MLRRAICMALALALSACAIHPATDAASFAAQTGQNSFELFGAEVDPPRTLLLPVTHDRQQRGAACGAHALASIINYWHGDGAQSGARMFAATPPADMRNGYSMAELQRLAEANGLLASTVRLPAAGLISELEAGRPVLVPLQLPSVYVQTWQLPGMNVPLLGFPAGFITSRTAWLSEKTGSAMLNHYLVVTGYEGDRFVVMEPVAGLRTISAERLERYRAPFGNAAIVFSKEPES
jgi:predicted double-glycine peptidase